MSTGVSGASGVPAGGIRNERVGSRKTSITAASSLALPPVMATSVSMRVGRRVPRESVPRSVMALNSWPHSACSIGPDSAAKASSACLSSAWAMVPMDS